MRSRTTRKYQRAVCAVLMDAHLSKSIDPPLLYATLEEYIGKRKGL